MRVKTLKDFLNHLNAEYDESEILVSSYENFCELRTSDIINVFAIDSSTSGIHNTVNKVVIVFED